MKQTHVNQTPGRFGFLKTAGAALMLGTLCSATLCQAAIVVKDNNPNNLNDPLSWVGGTAVPGSSDTAQWNSTVTAANSTILGDSLQSWGGILVTNPTGNVNINADGNYLMLGGGGIDMSGAAVNLTLGCDLSLAGSQVWTVAASRFLTNSGAISGTGPLTKAGTGSLILSGTNTYTGATMVNAGTLNLTRQVSLYNNNPAEWANLTVSSGATVNLNVGGSGEFTSSDITTLIGLGTGSSGFLGGSVLGLNTANAGGTFTQAGVIANPNGGASTLAITKLGAGRLRLTAANTYTGPTTVSAGVLEADSGIGLPAASALTLNAAVLASPGGVITNALGASGGQVRITGGTSGFTAVATNTIVALGGTDSPAAISWGSADFNPATLVLNDSTAAANMSVSNAFELGTANRTISVSTNTVTIAGTINSSAVGTSILTKTGGGKLVLTGANTYSGITTVSGGILAADAGQGLPSATALVLNGGLFAPISQPITMGIGSTPGQVRITGGTSGFTALNGNATLALGGVASPSTITWGSADFAPTTLVLNDAAATGDIIVSNSVDIGAGNRTISVATNTAVITGIITNSAATVQTLTKTGGGNLVLSNLVTYAATNINYVNNSPGTLRLSMPDGPLNRFGQIQQQGANGTLVLYTKAGTTNQQYGNGVGLRNSVDTGIMRFEGGTWLVPNLGQNSTGSQLRGTNYYLNTTVMVTNSGRFTVGNHFLQNGSSLIVMLDRLEYATAQIGAVTNLMIDVDEGAYFEVYATSLGALIGGGNGSAGPTTAGINQRGGTVNIGLRAISGSTKNLIIGSGNTAGSAAYYRLANGSLTVGGNIQANANPANSFYFNGGTLTAAGFLTAGFANGNMPDGTLVNNGGSLAPGGLGTPGKTAITGNYSNSAAGTIAIDLGGTTPANAFTNLGSFYDLVTVSGTAALGGRLQVNLVNGFTPAATDSFTILTASAGITGGLDKIRNNYNGYLLVSEAPLRFMEAKIVGNNLVLTNYGVIPPAIAASFSPSYAVGLLPSVEVTFTDTSVGAITNRHWDFGDGATLDSSALVVSHTYNSAGYFTNILTVRDASGASSSATGLVYVAASAPNLTWKGDGTANAWNTSVQNWLEDGVTPAAYSDPANVTFDDSGFNTPAVNISMQAQPLSVTFNNSSKPYTLTGSGGIAGNANLSLNGSGTVTLLTTNTYRGTTTVNSGTLRVGNGGNAGSIDNTTAITDNGTLIFDQADSHVIAAPISGSGALVKTGAGTLRLTGNSSTFNGPITNYSGTLESPSDQSLGTSGTLTLNNATLKFTGLTPFNLGRTLSLEGTNNVISVNSTVALAGNPGGNAAVTLVGSGAVVLGEGITFPTNLHLAGASVAFNRSDSYTPPGVISGEAVGSSITNQSTAPGNTNKVTFADGVNVFGNILNYAPAPMVLNGSSGSTNILGGTIGLGFTDTASGALIFNSGIYVMTNAGFSGCITAGAGGGNTIINGGLFHAAQVSASGGGARFMRGNVEVNGGTFHVSSGGLGLPTGDGQKFTLNGGLVLLDNSSGGNFYGLRLGNYNGTSDTSVYTKSVTGLQTGGSLVISNSSLDLGSQAASKIATYDLQAGSISILGANAALKLGADTNGTSTTTFTMTNGTLSVRGTISGAQQVPTAVQVLAFTGGDLSADAIDARYLRDAASNPAGTFVNRGGALLPGDAGYAGRTTITGNFSNAPVATLSIELGGTTAAIAGQQLTGAYHDNLVIDGQAVLDGRLNVSLINGFTPQPGDTFTILSAGSVSGTFTNVTGTPARVLVAGSTNSTFEVIYSGTSVVLANYQPEGATPPPAQTNISYTLQGGNQLVLDWPAGQGWRLESQTNGLVQGFGANNWVPVTPTPTPPFTNNINPANPTVFYRLVWP